MNAANAGQAREPVRIGVSSCLLGHAVRYDSGHKHNAYITQTLGRFAEAGKGDIGATLQRYISLLMEALRTTATPRQHANVLMHILGFFKRRLATTDKAELLDVIDAYRREQLPLIVPITLIKHHLRHYPDDYVSQQYYLNPHPRELMLRNHI